jgi:hypothetical protein
MQGEHSVRVEAWDHDTFSSDDLIGEGHMATSLFNVNYLNK